MSQGDYIHYKKIATELKNNTFPQTLASAQYTSFFSYSIENKVTNNKQIFALLSPPTGIPVVYDIPIEHTCPTFITCSGTNARPNRVPNSFVEIQPRPSRPLRRKNDILPLCTCIGGGIK